MYMHYYSCRYCTGMAFHCSMCSYTSTQFKQFSNHLVRYHRNDPHFRVHCSFSDCMYSTRSWNAFKLHVSRKHRHDRQSDDVNYVVSSSSCGSDDDAVYFFPFNSQHAKGFLVHLPSVVQSRVEILLNGITSCNYYHFD